MNGLLKPSKIFLDGKFMLIDKEGKIGNKVMTNKGFPRLFEGFEEETET